MNTQRNGKATASLVLGIIAIVFIFVNSVQWIGIICGIVGLVLGITARKEEPSGMATAGIVLSSIAIGMCLITFIACVACAGALLGGLSVLR